MNPLETAIAEVEAYALLPRPDQRALVLLQHMANGDTLQQAATHAGIPYGTATHLIADAKTALDANTTTQAVLTAHRHGLLDEVPGEH